MSYTYKSVIQDHLKMKHGIRPEDSFDHLQIRRLSWFDDYDYDGWEDSDDSDAYDFHESFFPFPYPTFHEFLDDIYF